MGGSQAALKVSQRRVTGKRVRRRLQAAEPAHRAVGRAVGRSLCLHVRERCCQQVNFWTTTQSSCRGELLCHIWSLLRSILGQIREHASKYLLLHPNKCPSGQYERDQQAKHHEASNVMGVQRAMSSPGLAAVGALLVMRPSAQIACSAAPVPGRHLGRCCSAAGAARPADAALHSA